MQTGTAQSMDLNAILDRVVPVAQMIMFGAMKSDGLQFSASMRESGAAAKYLANSQRTYQDNLIVQGIVRSLSHRKGEHSEKPDLRTLDTDEVMRRVDEIVPILNTAPMQQGEETKTFLYGLAEAVVNASGSGFMGSGERVTEGEARFLSSLKEHLLVSKSIEQAEVQQQPHVQQAQQQAAPTVAPPSAGDSDTAAQLQKLAELKQQGILSDEEFAAAKKKLLGG